MVLIGMFVTVQTTQHLIGQTATIYAFFCWGLDGVVHEGYLIMCSLATACVGKALWKKYENKNSGQHNFQIDLGIALMN
jgi:hypothetical protein